MDRRKVELIPLEAQQDILIYAFRYTLGRATYAVDTMVRVLIECWDDLSPNTQMLVRREIREALSTGRAGHDMDEDNWRKILHLPFKGV